jgi:hypothetical protein
MYKSSAGVSQESLSQEFGKFDFVSEKGASDINAFGSNDCNSLTCIIYLLPLRRVLAM